MQWVLVFIAAVAFIVSIVLIALSRASPPLRPISFVLPVIILNGFWTSFRVTLAKYGRGHCQACGYDRAGLDAGAACPECGGPADKQRP